MQSIYCYISLVIGLNYEKKQTYTYRLKDMLTLQISKARRENQAKVKAVTQSFA